jgi:hypothetical protein
MQRVREAFKREPSGPTLIKCSTPRLRLLRLTVLRDWL